LLAYNIESSNGIIESKVWCWLKLAVECARVETNAKATSDAKQWQRLDHFTLFIVKLSHCSFGWVGQETSKVWPKNLAIFDSMASLAALV